MSQDIWSERFHWCALAAGFIAVLEGRLQDSYYVRELAYEMYEDGAFADRVQSEKGQHSQEDVADQGHSVTGSQQSSRPTRRVFTRR
jgi:hypothetical protein